MEWNGMWNGMEMEWSGRPLATVRGLSKSSTTPSNSSSVLADRGVWMGGSRPHTTLFTPQLVRRFISSHSSTYRLFKKKLKTRFFFSRLKKKT